MKSRRQLKRWAQVAMALLVLQALPGSAAAADVVLNISTDLHETPNGAVKSRLVKASPQTGQFELASPADTDRAFLHIKVIATGETGWVRKHAARVSQSTNSEVVRPALAERMPYVPGVTRGIGSNQ